MRSFPGRVPGSEELFADGGIYDNTGVTYFDRLAQRPQYVIAIDAAISSAPPKRLPYALLTALASRTPRALGIEVPGLFLTLRIDEDGPHVTVEPDRRPDTILEADADVVLGLAAGALTVDQAPSGATVRGDRRVLATVLPG